MSRRANCWFSATFCIKTGSRRTASLTLFEVSTNNMLYYVGVLSGALVWPADQSRAKWAFQEGGLKETGARTERFK